jgi:gliding motility-associated-like protein
MKAKRLKLQSSFIQKNAKVFLFCFLLFIFIIPVKSQITIDNTKTNAQLVAQLLGSGVSASNVVFRGVRNVSTRYQVGAFSTATTTLAQMGFTGGVVLSTGNISDIPLALGTNPGTVGQMSYNYISGTTGEIRQSNPVAGQDADADNLVNVNYYNAAILEFDFVPVGDAVSFRYVFGSEEYSDQGGSINYQCSSYNDKFAFLISGPGIVGGQGYTNNARNIARLNNGAEVGINSVNGGVVGSSGGAPSAANCEAASLTAWVQNSPSAEYLGHIDGTELNGNTRILTASQTGLTPGGTYHIRLLVSDAQDGAYDAVVYIEAGSFTSPTATLTTSATPSTICSGNSTYAKTVVASGTAPYNYTWSNGVTHLNSPNPTDSILVSPGSTSTYTVTVVDNHLPTATTSVGSVIVTVTPLPTASISYTGSPFCTLVSPVSINLTGTNAYTGGAYSATPGLTINASTGEITPSSSTAGGPYTVTYTIAASGGCSAVTANSNVSISSPVSQTISGVSQLCTGLTNTFTVSPTTGGAWSSSATGVATVNPSTGLVTSVSAGSTIISYSVTTGGCVNNATQNLTITSPVSQSITGVSQLCTGSTNTFTNSPTVGGNWTSSVPGFATVNSSTGLVTGISAGTSLITYSVTTSGGCVNTATQNVTISAPVSQTITGVSQLCNGLTNSFSVSPSSGGVWASSATGVATVNSSTGLVTGISSGSTNITYTVTTTGGCVNTATQSLTVTNPVSQTITGASQICSGATANYTISPTTGGIWSSGTTGVATINSTSGLILAVSSGASTITYSVTTSGGCVNTATQTLTVNPLPNVTATSNVTLNSVCNGGNVTLTGGGANSYSWSGGITNGVSFTPITTNTYTVIGTDINTCQNSAQITVTVNSLPNISISGLSLNNPTACLGVDGQITGITVTGAPIIQYSWNGGANQLSPNLTGVTAGAYTLVATDGNGCVSSAGPYSLSDPGAPAAPTINILAGPVCEGSPFTLSINNPNALASYSWTGPSGSLGTGTSITISNASLSDAGSYSTQSTLSGCTGSSSSTTVTVTTLPTSSISYFTPFCSSNTNAQSVSQVGTGGGVFSSNIAGLTLNTSNGEITPSSSTAGTYIVTYTIAAAGGCATVTAKDTIEITLLPTANIIYNGSPFCSDLTAIQNVNLTGTIGGAYSAPAGLTLNTTNGEVTPNTSIAGNYSVTYLIPAANGCPLVSSTTAVTITTLPTANISYNGPFCSSEVNAQSVNLTGNSGGIYSSTLGLNLNLTTGSINPGLSTAGNYNVIYTISSSAGCPAVISTSNVTITELPVAAISYNGPFCSSLVTEQAVSLTGNNGGVYTAPLGLNINSGSGSINPGLSTAGNYNITYTIAASGGCPLVNAISNVTITTLPSASISYAGSPFCTNNNNLQSVIFTGTTGGLYTSTSGLNIEANTGSINPSLSNEGNYTITYTIAASGGCSDVISYANIEIVKSVLPVTVFNYNTPVCSNGSNPIPLTIANFTSGGAYTSTSGLNLDVNSGVINLVNTIPGTYSVTYSIAQSGCMLAGNTTSTITIDQTITPVTGFIYEIPECVDAIKPNPITNSGFTIGGSYSSLPSGLTIDAITGEINLLSSIPGIYTVSYSIASNGCSLAGNSNDDVNINREGCLNIPTAFSPNNDGVNDTWEIEHINLYSEVSIEIYNRWGQLMFEFSGTGDSYADIDNQWNGKYEGKDLPINSFIFIVNLYNDKEPIQGIVTIVK